MKSASWVESTGLPAAASSSTDSDLLSDGWRVIRTEAGLCASPADLPRMVDECEGVVPGTVAEAAGPPGLSGHDPYDDFDWWYVRDLTNPDPAAADRARLRFDGLATLTEVWLDEDLILTSDNMFTGRVVDVTDGIRGGARLALCFRSLSKALATRRPRPRWKTDLVGQKNLRWFRTTLLGRIPTWTPRVQPVGPWRPAWLQRSTDMELRSLELRTGARELDGWVELRAELMGFSPDFEVRSATLEVAGHELPLPVRADGEGQWSVDADVTVPDPGLWWPRTHGDPRLHQGRLVLQTSAGIRTVDLGRLGFRSVDVDEEGGRVSLQINGVPVFCRGACWTTDDPRSLHGNPERIRKTLGLLADANANMVRVGGTMVYERDEFYAACDELGLLVWQDFMFANMDYPVDDSDFRASVQEEATHQIRRLARHPSVVAYCGGSEVEQQAAMFGAPKAVWRNDFFGDELPRLVSRLGAGVPYWPSTPTGGALPFHTGEGLTHYYGVGAYRRPLTDVRLAGVRFTPECLGFSNMPEPSNLAGLGNGRGARHDPAWKAGVPRDAGAGWDFEDIRDHYLEVLYDVDAVTLRSEDPARYDRLARVVTGRVMDFVFQEWRASATCGGGLVWFAKDLQPGAGWGIIDSDNHPKPVYYYLKRAWAPLAISLLDRGLDGMMVVICNDGASPVEGEVDVTLVRDGSVVVGRGSAPVTVPPRSRATLMCDSLFEHFTDSTYSYRFGPRGHDAVICVFTSSELPEPLTRIHWLDLSVPLPSVDLDVAGAPTGSGFSLQASGLARDVRIDAGGWIPADNYFDLVPGTPRRVSLAPGHGDRQARTAYVDAGATETAVSLPERDEGEAAGATP